MSLRYNLLILILLILSGCKTSHTAKNNKTSLYKSEVFACYHHNNFNGRKTASGEDFSNKKLTAAHKKLPFGTLVKLTNPQNKNSVIVNINHGGLFTKVCELDLSKKTVDQITHVPNTGKIKVILEIINHST